VVLSDGTAWTLSYDNYGDITRLGFPTGGSITYGYTHAPVTFDSQSASMWVSSRSVDANDGTGPHTWNYHYSGQITSTPIGNGQLQLDYSGTAIVTSPDGNDIKHTIANPVPGAYAAIHDTQVQYYQGSSTAGTLLKTASTQYAGTIGSLEQLIRFQHRPSASYNHSAGRTDQPHSEYVRFGKQLHRA